MKSSGPHDAPATPVSVSSATVIVGPPLTDTIRILYNSRKPTFLPSGEKNGVVTPSVPGIAVACSWSRDRIRSCALGPPMYARVEPSGESAMRPDPDGPFAIASVESTTSLLRTTGFAEAGRIQPRIAAPVIRIASGITAYSANLSRRRVLPGFNVVATAESATAGLGGTSAFFLVDANRSREVSAMAGRL